jgi:hypothetical protein
LCKIIAHFDELDKAGLRMDSTQKMLFSLQRFQILTLFATSSAESNVTPSYALAWSEGIYPFLNESSPWHEPFEELFPIRREHMEELDMFLCTRWDMGQWISFSELEETYEVRGAHSPGPVWSRQTLIAACRYFYMHENFDSSFWSALLEAGKCPNEALHAIGAKFEPHNVQF